MLEYLASIFSRITELFGGLWFVVIWLLKSAYNTIYSYVTDLHPSVQDYKWYRVATLIYYQYTARPKTDDIAVTNYSKTRYSAVDSFLDIFNYRTYFKNTVDWLSGTAKVPIQTIVIGGFSALYNFITRPKETISYLFGRGFSILFEYDTVDKSTVKKLAPRTSKVVHITDEPKYGFLDTLTGGLYGKLKDYATRLYPSTEGLFNNLERFFTLVGNLLFGRITDLGGDKYPRLASVAENWQKLAYYIEQKNLTRANYLFGDKFDKLKEMLEQPEKSIFDTLKGKFFEWFLSELWEWLNEEI
jgi:hypothetical protein